MLQITLGMLLWRCPRISSMRLRQNSAAHRRPGPRLASQRPRPPQPCRCHSIIAYLLPLLLFCLIPPALAQKTIHIPTDQPTIQGGINAAVPGDTVLVAPGTYDENIDFKGKAITVSSSAGPATTIIDGGNVAGSAVVAFKSQELRASILSGFTIQHGGTQTAN